MARFRFDSKTRRVASLRNGLFARIVYRALEDRMRVSNSDPDLTWRELWRDYSLALRSNGKTPCNTLQSELSRMHQCGMIGRNRRKCRVSGTVCWAYRLKPCMTTPTLSRVRVGAEMLLALSTITEGAFDSVTNLKTRYALGADRKCRV
eukprot:gene260-474_t